jgi:hypothetical protein
MTRLWCGARPLPAGARGGEWQLADSAGLFAVPPAPAGEVLPVLDRNAVLALKFS